ncbi:MAG: CYTH and CHAD domain-containing protein [Negativicutes bacterium]|nr:CYTH and CHAD domain-containing protein [Negativicutes bacterium]
MGGNREIELKLRLADASRWREVMAWAAENGLADVQAWRHEILEAQYFDTKERDLQQARLAYRIRCENGKCIAAVKGGGSAAGGLHQRSEWEVEIDAPDSLVTTFAGTPVGKELAELVGDKPLEMLFSTRFDRHAAMLRPDVATAIELVIDRGAIIAGDKQEPIQEIELELKSGSLPVLLDLAADLAARVPLLFEERSKYHRGLVLAGLERQPPKKKPAPAAAPGQTDGGARRLLIEALHGVLKWQTRLLTDSAASENLHRLRVKLRRLRALLAFFRPLLPEEECTAFQQELREWSRLFGPVRDIDVLLEAWQAMIASGALALRGQQWLIAVLSDERAARMQTIMPELARGSATPMFLRLWSWLETALADVGGCRQFIVKRAGEWMQDMLEFGKAPDFADMDVLHRLRIEGKKLRYCLDTVELPGVPAEDLIEKLKKMQDALGFLRDARSTAATLNALLAGKSSRALHREAGLLIGWQARGAYERRESAFKTWRKVRRRLNRLLQAYL